MECGFHYFTARESFYELPEEGCLSLNGIPQLPGRLMSLADQRALRHWRDSSGQSFPQVTVRNQVDQRQCWNAAYLLVDTASIYSPTTGFHDFRRSWNQKYK